MMRKCHLNTCPVGIATQDPVLRKKFTGKPEHVVNYLFMVAEEARRDHGAARLPHDQRDGRPRRSARNRRRDRALEGRRARPDADADAGAEAASATSASTARSQQDHGLEEALDNELIASSPSRRSSSGKPVAARAADREHQPHGRHDAQPRRRQEVGRRTACRTTRSTSSSPARPGKASARCCAKGVTLELEGDANDYVGKGLSGGRIIIYPPHESHVRRRGEHHRRQRRLYGATSGRGLLPRRAAERFCVRNSGAKAVVEGVGDHGCEYMTGGRVVILGPTGRNFAAGMSRRHRLRLGPGTATSRRNCNLGTGRTGTRRRRRRHRRTARADRAAPATTPARPWPTQILDDWDDVARAVRQGHADRLQTRARSEAAKRDDEARRNSRSRD